MKQGFVIEGKMLNIDLLLKIADRKHASPEDMSKMMGMSATYLRNRRNENKHGIYREAQSEVVKRAMEAFDLPYEVLLIDIPAEGRWRT
jgi:hypothetical protein